MIASIVVKKNTETFYYDYIPFVLDAMLSLQSERLLVIVQGNKQLRLKGFPITPSISQTAVHHTT